MLLISYRGITKTFGSTEVLKGVDLDISQGDRIGLVGGNGAGKTTLVRLIFGALAPDEGAVIYGQPVIRTGYLLQSADVSIGEVGTGGAAVEPGFDREEFLKKSGLLGIAGVESWDRDRLEGMSGGEKTKLALTRVLAHRPDLLLLDEPTNHLDFQGVEWLSNELEKYRGTLVAISHDRYFLDKIANRIVELEDGTARNYSGNYTQYRLEKKREYENRLHQYVEQEKRKERIQEEMTRLRQWSAKSHREAGKVGKMAEAKKGGKEFYRIAAKRMDRRVKSKIKRLERMITDGVERPQEELSMNFSFQAAGKHGKRILEARGLTKGYGERNLFRDASFYLLHGDRVGLLGANGCGKSTLLRIIRGEESPDSGEIWISPSASVTYIRQDVDDLPPDRKPMEILGVLPGLQAAKARTILSCLGIEGPMLQRNADSMSMGERMRIKLAAAILDGKDFLILDEPTNHLDLYSRERLEEALAEYEGTLLLVSHDRYMLDQVCNRLLVFEDGGILPLQGGLGEYLDRSQVHRNVRGTLRKTGPEPGEKLSSGTGTDPASRLLLENRIAEVLGRLSTLPKGHPQYIALEEEFNSLVAQKRRQG